MPLIPQQVEWKGNRSPARGHESRTIDLEPEKPSERPPMRTYSLNHPQAGYLQFTIPYMNPHDVEAYLAKKLADLSTVERMTLHNDLMKIATQMWDGFCLWVGDPVKARLQLRSNDEVAAWFDAEGRN